MAEDIKDLADRLGYAWPEDETGQRRCLLAMAKMAAYWRRKYEQYETETRRELNVQRLYIHQRKRLIAQTRRVTNLRRALRLFMRSQIADNLELLEEINSERRKLVSTQLATNLELLEEINSERQKP